jgi:hypothetical protein
LSPSQHRRLAPSRTMDDIEVIVKNNKQRPGRPDNARESFRPEIDGSSAESVGGNVLGRG